MRVAWGRKRESRPAGWLAGWLMLPSLTVYVCVCVCMCVLVFTSTVTPPRVVLHTHVHTLPRWHHGWEIPPQQKCPHFNFQLRRSPGPCAVFQMCWTVKHRSGQKLVSLVCKITVIANKVRLRPLGVLFTSHFFLFSHLKDSLMSMLWACSGYRV